MSKIKLVYIAGDGRSGSTLLDRLLGEVDGLFSCGEIWNCWNRAFVENQKCACDAEFSECEYWQRVVNSVENSVGVFDVDALIKIQKRIMRIRYVPYMIFPAVRPKWYSALLQKYISIILPFYTSISLCSDAKYIVDSSKMPIYGLLLYATGKFDLHIIHLVRNSLAVAYSWKRRKVRPEIAGAIVYMPVQSCFESALGWVKHNLLSGLLTKLNEKSMLMRYEDLTSSPQQAMNKIFSMTDLNVSSPVNGANMIELGSNHIISGNPMRFKRGRITIQNDTEWKTDMKNIDKIVVTIIAAPLMLLYRYNLFGKYYP